MAFVCPECGRSYPAGGFCTEDGGALNDDSFSPLLGSMVGAYRVATLIGQGGMGEVYRGVHPEIGSRVAIKVLSSDAARAPSLAERFFAEARAVNVVRHEGIVSVLDLNRLPDGRPYIVMEYLDGAPLTRVIEMYRPAPLGAMLQILLNVLDALGAAHAQGITHRDLKPDNIFVTSTGRTKVLDFGIAKLRPDIAGVSGATKTGALLGTPHYMSPEQARGQAVDHRSDIYSLGMIAFELFTGQRPFHAENLYDLLRQHIEVRPPSLCELRPEIPRALESVVLRALEKDPARRQQTTEELAAELRQTAPFLPAESFVTLTGVPTSVPRPVLTPGAQAGRTAPTAPGYAATLPEQRVPVKRGPSPLLWGGVGVLVLGGGMALSAVVALVVFGDRDTITIVETKPPAEPKSGAAPPKAPAAGVTNLKRVEAVQFYPKALELARQQLPGAELSTLSVDEPESDGSVDFAKSDGTITYTFTAKGEVASVTLDGEAPVVAKLPVVTFMTGTVRAPRCTVGKVLERSAVSGEDIVVSYGPAASWTVIGADDVKMVPDDC
ncbi:MAG: serine/threonine protein kinase [Polyangiaceae bacterium]|nr:serine/threonine protein kinase [Polyangiaceae bacterium]MCE7888562.1 serine/threonine protein kinase [Sorangiineae bacterium PRO1]MCL4749072.1 serine/threonine protein kinase [Myxococcales bacterium]